MSLSHARKNRRRAISRRRWLQFESMEERNLMAIYIVQAGATGGATGDGTPQNPFSTITQAVNAAKLNPGADEIQVGSGNYTETLNITDAADLTIRGNASVRPTLNRAIGFTNSSANFVLENLNINSITGQGVVVSNVIGQAVSGPYARQGSLALNNMKIQVNSNAPFWDCVSVQGANQFTANNLELSFGRVILNDVNAASLSQITTITSRTNALVATYVTQLDVNGWTADQPAGTGIVVTNPIRSVNTVPTPVNAPSVVNLTGVQITSSGGHGLDAGVNTSLNVLNSSFKTNALSGMQLTGVTSFTGENIDASGNTGIGVFINNTRNSTPTTFTGRNITANSNKSFGFFSPFSGAISIVGAAFSDNTAAGIFSDLCQGTIQLSDVVASTNKQVGVFLRSMSGNVTLNNLTTNANLAGGTSVLLLSNSPTAPSVSVSGGQSSGNTQIGLNITNMGAVNVDGYQAIDNGGFGMNIAIPSRTVSVSNSQFSHNSQVVPTTPAARPGVIFSGLKSGLTLNNVTANNNPIDGIIVDNPVGQVVASGISASGNPLSGLFVDNGNSSFQASLTLTDSNLSNNGRSGLLSNLQSRVTILRTHFDSNGPKEDQTGQLGIGAWIASPGTGGVIIEDSTAIGTHIGTQSGAGIQITGASGPEVQIRRVTINESLVHPLTTTNSGAGLVVTGSATAARVEDSTFNQNQLLDGRALRATIFTTVPLFITRSQLLDNEGYAINTTAALSMQDSTVARTIGIGVFTAGGGTILRSTISGNAAEAVIQSSGQLSIEHSTLTGNATTPRVSAPPFVIQNGGTLRLFNSIVAGNGPDSWAFSNSALAVSSGFNLLSGAPVGFTGVASDIVGDINNRIDPLLGPLTNNGGPTLTHMPLAGSPALEAGSLGNALNDQRGISRPQSLTGAAGALPDIGAVEAASVGTAPTILVNSRIISTNEGGVLTVRGRVTDIDGNLTSLVASSGSIQLNSDGTFQWTLATVDDLSVAVTLTATDALGGVGTTQIGAIANNVAPTLNASYFADPQTRTINVQAIATDPGTADTFTFTVDWGDGTIESFPNTTNSQSYSHVYGATWSRIVVVSVKDDDGGSSPLLSLVINTAPMITLDSSGANGYEGSQLSLTGRVNDLEGNLSNFTATQGTLQLNPDGTFLWTFNGVDDLLTTVFLIATDASGASSSTSFTAEVKNVAPVLGAVTITADWTTRIITLHASVTDAGTADTHQFNIKWDDLRTTSVAAGADGTLTASQQYFAGSGPVTITIQAVDDDHGLSQIVTVAANVSPTIQLDAPSVSGNEGSPLTLTGRATDAEGNLVSLTTTIGSVQLNADGTFLWTLTPTDNFDATASLTARDALGASVDASFAVAVANVAPTVGPTSLTRNGTSATIASIAIDPGLADTQTFGFEWIDGSELFVQAASNGSISQTIDFGLAGEVLLKVRAIDDDGASSFIQTLVVNSAPALQLDSTSVSSNEGTPLTLTGRVSDVENNLVGLTSSLGSIQLNADGTFSWSYLAVDDLNTTVTITATDVFGAATTSPFSVIVNNVAPTLGGPSIVVNQATKSVTLNTSVSDLGLADTHLFTIQWGDGSSSSVAPDALRNLSAKHQYATSGVKTITYFATDDDGGRTATATVSVNLSPAIQVDVNPVIGNEGSVLSVTGRVLGFNESLQSVTATLGSLQWNANGTFVWTYNGVDDLSKSVELVAIDAFGAVARRTFTANVKNVAPSLGATSSTLNIATRTVTINTSVIDVGLADTHLFTIQWGDGTSSQVAPAGNRTLSVSHQYTALGPVTITVKATDDDGASSASTSVSQVIPGFAVRNRELFVYGSSLADTVSFGVPNRGQVTANANFGGTSVPFTFGSNTIDAVIAYLAGGNDVWNGNTLQETQYVFGETGNDQITTGDFDDILVGGDGTDTLNGGGGKDLLFGGLGADSLFGQDGGDVLVAGRYERENDLAALRMLRTAWTGSGSYQTRVSRLRSGVGTDSQGITVKLTISQITDDAIDQLFGGNDVDWYLTNAASEVRGASRDESIN